MAEPFLGQIMLVGFTFAPRGWAFCSGQLLPIAQNTALFSLLGTTYGGNGQTTFALPDLRGRVAVGMGQGPGLPQIFLGEVSGETAHTLLVTEMPSHNHSVRASTNTANSANPNGNSLAVGQVTLQGTAETVSMYVNAAPNVSLNLQSELPAGGSQPHNNMQPYLGMNYVIALAGIFPSRN
jgi:Microcystin-dependent protein